MPEHQEVITAVSEGATGISDNRGESNRYAHRTPHVALELWLLPRNAAIAFMQLYRRVISPLYGDVCRYYPSCSRYALEAFQRQGFIAGVVLTGWRLLRCNPYSRGGVDDAPERRQPRTFINTRGFVRPAPRKA